MVKLPVDRLRLEHVAKAFAKFDRLCVRPDWQDFSTLMEEEREFPNGARRWELRPMRPRDQVIEVDSIDFDTGELRGKWKFGPDAGGSVVTSVNFVWPLSPRGNVWVSEKSHPYGDRAMEDIR